ncbi:class I SAM-dependent methyltransferase [Enhygromyxa salina]|nr:class I SAM-dependent methyltransferase [Enhygromyxa salina]
MSKRSLTISTTLSLGLALTLFACDKTKDESVNADDTTPAKQTEAETSDKPAFADLDSVLAGAHRGDNAARDSQRHPKETLEFFGVEPSMTVVELSAGGGWYTEILGPYLRDQGKLIVTHWPTTHERYGSSAQKFADKVNSAPEIYGDVTIAIAPLSADDAFEPAPEGSVDVVLTFRNSHGWYNNGQTQQIYGAAFKALKPGGIFGVVQHRAAEGADPEQTSKQGYLPESVVIATAQEAGFELVEKSEINANPKDTKDHPSGVWTLPPSLSGPEKGVEQSEEELAKHNAIGESDRMTLKFKKPG